MASPETSYRTEIGNMALIERPPVVNTDADRLERVVAALVAGDRGRAEDELAPIAGQTRADHPTIPMPRLPAGSMPVGTDVLRPNRIRKPPGYRDQATIYWRDRFTCCYCGRRTVHLGPLRLLSNAFPSGFPYQDNWKYAETHRLYWDISASLEHRKAVSTGGGWRAPENLATACARCQYQKGTWTLEELGWSFVPADTDTRWLGLTEYYEPLWRLAGEPRGDHVAWLAAFDAARRSWAAERSES
jgi:5-methylcytosine-specific restriction endonuclease McrA